MGAGRPIEWTAENKENAIHTILSEIESGKSLKKITDENNELPSRRLFYEWLDNDEQLRNNYARACEVRQDGIFDEIFDIADETINDTIEMDLGDGVVTQKQNTEWINRSRLRIDARKWALSKMNPKKYGEQIDVTTKGEKIGQYSDWTPEQLEAELKRLNE